MAKKPNPSKAKVTPKKPAKIASKPNGKDAAKAKPTLKDRVTAGLKSLVKPSRKESPSSATPAKQSAALTKAPTPKPGSAKSPMPKTLAKAGKGADKSKKKAKKTDEDEDFLSDPNDMEGAEELPDLTDFDVEESAEDVTDDTDDSDEDSEELALEAPQIPDEIILTDAEGRRYCKVKECDQISSVEGYCRFHYLLLWKKIQVRRKILVDGKLEKYVEDLTSRYPDKFLEMIRRDLKTEKDFMAAIAELEIDESALDSDFEDEAQNFIDEVRGVTSEAGMSDEEEF